MLAEIIIDELQLNTIIGCMKDERTTPQEITLSLAIQYDIKAASSSDNIENALNYANICHDLKTFIESSSYHLLEALSEAVLNRLFETEKQIKRISLFIYKPNAISFTKRIGIKRTRERSEYSASSPPPQNEHTLNWD